MNRLTDMEFDEISLVTRPANQLSKVVLFKSDEQQEQSVTTEVDKGYGKMGMKKKMKPMTDEEIMAMSEEEIAAMEDEEPMKKGSGMKRRGRPVRKDDDLDEETSEDVIDLPNEVFEYISALESANAELLDQVEKLAKSVEVVAEEEDIMKSADPQIVALVKSFEERAKAAETIAKSERDFRLEREFVSKASTLNALPIESDSFGKVLKGVAESVSSEQFKVLWEVLSAANSALAESNLFTEVGKSGDFDNDGATSPINKAAERILATTPNLTREQAIAKALESDPNLYTAYLRGN
jgi:hypothetical protein